MGSAGGIPVYAAQEVPYVIIATVHPAEDFEEAAMPTSVHMSPVFAGLGKNVSVVFFGVLL